MECFNCSKEASRRSTLILPDPKAVKDEMVCDECFSVFQEGEWIEVYEGPALFRGGKSRSIEGSRPPERYHMGEVLKTLSDPIRRGIIHFFENHTEDTTASLEEVVAHIERQISLRNGDALWKTLYQVHLPALQSEGWLEFETERKIITYHGHDEAEQLLRDVLGMFSA